MFDINDLEKNKTYKVKEILGTLNYVNYQIAELMRIKEQLELRVNNLLEHPEDLQKTYIIDKYKVTITSKWIYSLDKEEYAVIGSRLSPEFNPVKTKTSYEIDKKIMRAAEKYASEKDMQLLSSIVTKKQGKLHIKLSAGV